MAGESGTRPDQECVIGTLIVKELTTDRLSLEAMMLTPGNVQSFSMDSWPRGELSRCMSSRN